MVCRIAVCDDSRTDAEYVLKIIEDWSRARELTVHVKEFPSAESFLFHYEESKSYDILLLDIEMGAMDGVAMAKQVRRDNETVQIVFVTGYSEYIAEGYEVAALHYLMKPVNEEKLFAVLDRALEKQRQNEKCLNVSMSGEMVRIPFYQIRYLEVQKNYVTIHGKEDYTVKRTLSEFEKELDDSFCRVGRAFILNLKYIRRVTKTEVHLADETVLPLPRGSYELLNRAIIKYT